MKQHDIVDSKTTENAADSEVSVQKRPQMDEKSLFCLGWHFNEMYEQAKYEEMADFGAPCETCKYISECGAHWDEMRVQLAAATGIKVSTLITPRDRERRK
jgi:hypothetical protein